MKKKKKSIFAAGAGMILLGAVVYVATIFSTIGELSAVSGSFLPSADGSYSQLKPKSGSVHYVMVDESTCNGNTDYNYTTTVGGRDSYRLDISSVPNGSTISQINIAPCASANSILGSSYLKVFYRANGVNSADSPEYTLSGTTPSEKTPASFGGLNIVKGSATVLEIGAVYSSGKKGLRLSRLSAAITYSTLSAPTNLTANASGTTAVLNWSDNSSNETGFVVERSLTVDGTYSAIITTGANVAKYFDNGLARGQTYYYRVKAVNGGGSSAYSNIASVSIPQVSPAAPTNLTASVNDTAVALSWVDNSSNETGFVVERSLTVDGAYSVITTTGANVVNYSDSGLARGQTYYYRVKAVNAGGSSAYSNIASAAIPQILPAAPTNLRAVASSTAVTLTWTDASNNETGFVVERSLTVDGAYSVIANMGANVAYYYDNGLARDQTYYYRVKAVNDGGSSAYSNIASAAIPQILPAAPTNLRTIASSTIVNLTWTDNSNNESGFKIEKKQFGGTFAQIATTPANMNYYSETGSLPGVYFYRVSAYNSAGDSAYSNTATTSVH